MNGKSTSPLDWTDQRDNQSCSCVPTNILMCTWCCPWTHAIPCTVFVQKSLVCFAAWHPQQFCATSTVLCNTNWFHPSYVTCRLHVKTPLSASFPPCRLVLAFADLLLSRHECQQKQIRFKINLQSYGLRT